MRTCMYCGKELKQGETCTCTQAAAHRARKQENTSDNQTYTNAYRTETSYRTGYAGKDTKFERARARSRAKKAAKQGIPQKDTFLRYIKSALLSPADAVANPTRIGKLAMLMVPAVLGAFLWLCVFFVMRGQSVRLMHFVAGAMGLGGGDGLKLAVTVPVVMLSGVIGGIVIFFAHMGIFWLINRFIMRLKTPFWEFCLRLTTAWVPLTAICVIGAALSILSPITIGVLLLCGGLLTAALTYEALKNEWSAYPSSKVLYSLFLGYFVLLAFVSHLIFI